MQVTTDYLENLVWKIHTSAFLSNILPFNRKEKVKNSTIERLLKRKKLVRRLGEEYLINYVIRDVEKNFVDGIPKVITDRSIKYYEEAVANKLYNTITVNLSLMQMLAVDEQDFSTKSKWESILINKNVKTIEDYLLWVMCHEVTHLFYPELYHGKQFSERVEEFFINTKNNNK